MANPIITPHPLYLSLAHDIQQRCQAYKALFASRLEPETHEHINTSSKTSIPLGNDRFREAVERELGRKVNTARKGRPPKFP